MPEQLPVRMDPLNAQGYRTQRAELPEDLWQPLYDRVNYAAGGASQLSFFTTPRGQSATLITAGVSGTKTKSYRDTNMDNAGVSPVKLYKIEGISVAYVHLTETAVTNGEDRAAIRNGGVLHIRVVDKDILYLPLIALPEMNPMSAVSTTVNARTVWAQSPGGRAPMYRFPLPITINPYENFQVTFDFDGTVTVTNAVDVYCILHAYMRRPT